MTPSLRTAMLTASMIVVIATQFTAGAQRRVAPRHPPHPVPAVRLQGQVFIGGYFYDPHYGPYPWWPRGTYPYWYNPIFDRRAEVRLKIEPREAERAGVYVDGFYAGIVDDFNGVFQALPLPPGGHVIELYLEGFRTVRRNVYLRPASTFTLRLSVERLPPGSTSEQPAAAALPPPPPAGTYRPPVTPAPQPVPVAPPGDVAQGFGTLDIVVQPADAELLVDSQRWDSSDRGHYLIQVPAGEHQVEVRKDGYRAYRATVQVSDGEQHPVHVSLGPGTDR